jgi:hypothetical protein
MIKLLPGVYELDDVEVFINQSYEIMANVKPT